MKLSTFNFLTSMSIRGVKIGYPLKLTIQRMQVVKSDFNIQFITRLIPKLDWAMIYSAAQEVDLADDVPMKRPENFEEDNELLERLHHLLLEVDIVEGQLECPDTGRIFPIIDGIPHMLVNEDEHLMPKRSTESQSL